MSEEKTNVSVYRLRAGSRADVEAQFANRTPLQNGLDGWFYLFPPSERTPQWILSLEPYFPDGLVDDIHSAAHGALVLICRQGVDYLLAFGFAWTT